MAIEKHSGKGKYRFSLYIDSETPRCSYVADRLQQLCQNYLAGCYTVEVIDLREDPSVIEREHIIAVPTLLVTTPKEQKHRFVGDLSQSELFIEALGMAQEAAKMGEEAERLSEQAVKMREKIQFP
jgi:circadian clock protein KaiB